MAESQSPAYEPHPVSRDIRLPAVAVGPLKLRPVIHHTDTVSVDVVCSGAPIAADIWGLIRLTKALVKVDERLLRRLEDCNKGQAVVIIPDPDSWIVTQWHFNRDSLNAYNGKQFESPWQVGQNELLRVYSKEFAGTVRGRTKTKVRVEEQQYPRLPVEQLIRNVLYGQGSRQYL